MRPIEFWCVFLIKNISSRRVEDYVLSISRKIWDEYRTTVRRLPWPIYMLITHPRRIMYPKNYGNPVTRSTAIAIEGFQRSANSFAVNAFLFSQGDNSGVQVASHLHAPTHVRRALKLKVPVLIVIREPDGAILSDLMKAPHRNVRHAYEGYVDFYTYVFSVLTRVVVATYDEVTTDFGAVISRVNNFYNTQFRTFEHTESNVQEVFRRLDDHVLRYHGVTEVDTRKIARPTNEKQILKNTIREIITHQSIEDIRLEADALYRKILAMR